MSLTHPRVLVLVLSLMSVLTSPALAHMTEMTEMKCIAHRAHTPESVENSIEGMRKAVELGIPGVEFDIHHTRDGVAILMHDSELGSMVTHRPGQQCPLGARISKLRFEQIRASCQLTNGEPVPTLADAFEVLEPTSAIALLEMKDKPSNSTLNLLKRHYWSRGDQLRIVSSNVVALWTVHWKLRKLLSRGTKLFHTTGNPWFILTKDGVDIGSPSHKAMRWLKRRNMEISVWTINDAAQMKSYRDQGAHYLTTDQPELCMRVAAGQH